MNSLGFIIVAGTVLGFGLVSGRVHNRPITPPMVFVAVGVLVGPAGLGWVAFDIDSRWIHTLAELTLVLVLFIDASRIDLGALRSEHDLPVRLLAIGMPLAVIAGVAAALAVLPGLNVWQAALIAAILAPTDAALGQAVVSSSRVPVRIRQALNVESGLNDGIALPLVLIFLSCVGAAEHKETAAHWVRFVALQLGFGPLVGVIVGYAGAVVIGRAAAARWMSQSFQELSSIGVALLAFGGAELVGGNGFIAAFCAGLAMGNACRHVCARVYEFGEVEGQLLTLLIFVVFGVTCVPLALHHLDWRTLLYALLSLTVVRGLPVAISLARKKLRRETVAFLGWFGPRGIASILFGLVVLEEAEIAVGDRVLGIVSLTVLLSVYAHGLTAAPAAGWYARRVGAMQPGAGERVQVGEMPLRHGSAGAA